MDQIILLGIIPGVHASIIGIFIAFFSAYFFFVYQKITEAQENIDRFVKELEHPVFYKDFYNFSSPEFQEYLDDKIVYEKFKSNFFDILDLSIEVKHFNISDNITKPNDEEHKKILEIQRKLNNVWSHYNNTIYYIYYGLGLIPQLDDFNSNKYLNNKDKFKLYSELIEFYSSKHRIPNLIECSNAFNSVYKIFRKNEALRHCEKYKKSGDYEKVKPRILESYNIQSDIIKYETCIENIKNFLDFYYNHYPEIIYRINKLKKIHKTFRLEKYFRVCLSFFLIVIIFGILTPLFAIKYLSKYDPIVFNIFCITSSLIENIIIFISFAPYIGICLYSFFKFGLKK